MAAELERELKEIIERKGRATELSSLIRGYSLCARTEGKSPNTITLTATALTFLRAFLEAGDLPTDVTLIGPEELRGFIGHLQEVRAFGEHPSIPPRTRGLSGHSINCYLRAIRAFWSWLLAEDIIRTNPFSRVKIPRPPHKVVPTFSEAEIRTILGTLDTSAPEGFRGWTIILVLLDTGLRVSELAGLKVEDVKLDEGMLKVTGKGAKERMVPIGAKVQRAIWKYVERYRPEPASPSRAGLFLTRRGDPLTKGRVETLLRHYGQKAGLQGVRCSPHTFRHTFAITYLRNGGDVFSLQRILGHSSLDVVRVYVNLAQTDVKAAHRRYSPADNMELGRAKPRAIGRGRSRPRGSSCSRS